LRCGRTIEFLLASSLILPLSALDVDWRFGFSEEDVEQRPSFRSERYELPKEIKFARFVGQRRVVRGHGVDVMITIFAIFSAKKLALLYKKNSKFCKK
jgi:hypothetical protein